MGLSKSDIAVPEVIRWRAMRRAVLLLFPAVFAGAVAAAQNAEQLAGQGSVQAVLARIAARVEQYFARAQSLVCQEAVSIQSPDSSWSANLPFSRNLLYEMRVVWDPATADDGGLEARTERKLLAVNGRPPKPDDKNDCYDPQPISPEPLGVFLPRNQQDYVFALSGTKRIDGRPAIVIDYKPREPRGKPEVTWKEHDCVSIELPRWEKGRVWVDAETGDVLRLDTYVMGRVDVDIPRDRQHPFTSTFMELKRADTSIRYKPVVFHDPEEVLLLPESVETLQVFDKPTHIRQRFTNYRRFMTGGRIVK